MTRTRRGFGCSSRVGQCDGNGTDGVDITLNRERNAQPKLASEWLRLHALVPGRKRRAHVHVQYTRRHCAAGPRCKAEGSLGKRARCGVPGDSQLKPSGGAGSDADVRDGGGQALDADRVRGRHGRRHIGGLILQTCRKADSAGDCSSRKGNIRCSRELSLGAVSGNSETCDPSTTRKLNRRVVAGDIGVRCEAGQSTRSGTETKDRQKLWVAGLVEPCHRDR